MDWVDAGGSLAPYLTQASWPPGVARSPRDERLVWATANQNLRHPCVRYLLLDKLDDGLQKLRDTFGADMDMTGGAQTHANAIAHQPPPPPGSPPPAAEQARWGNGSVEAAMRAAIAPSLRLYEWAERAYEATWRRPVVSCNAGRTDDDVGLTHDGSV